MADPPSWHLRVGQPFVRIGMCVGCASLPAGASSSRIAASFLAFLASTPVTDLLTELTDTGSAMTWTRLASDRPLQLEAVLSEAGRPGRPGASALLLLPVPATGQDEGSGRVARLCIDISHRTRSGPLPSANLARWHERIARALETAAAFHAFLHSDLGVPTRPVPPACVGVLLQASRSLDELVDAGSEGALPGTRQPPHFLGYAIGDTAGEPADGAARDLLARLGDRWKHKDGLEHAAGPLSARSADQARSTSPDTRAQGKSKRIWPRADRLQLAALIVAVIAILVGVIVAVNPQRTGCVLHLGTCPDNGSVAALPGNPRPAAPAPIDRNLPYHVPDPPPAASRNGGGDVPGLGLDVTSILNRGAPVVVTVSGSGFFAFSRVKVTWYTPVGAVYLQEDIPTDDQGVFQQATLWKPVRKLGASGNDGPWKISAVDLASGQGTSLQLDVSSDKHTPPPADWSSAYHPAPLSPAEVNAATSGYLCTGPGAMSDVSVRGFAPESRVEMAVYDADDGLVLHDELTTDQFGQISDTDDFWRVSGCSSTETFDYTVVVADVVTGRRAQAIIGLTTK
jgi:hypothetical protein